jgi:hypothetical protein
MSNDAITELGESHLDVYLAEDCKKDALSQTHEILAVVKKLMSRCSFPSAALQPGLPTVLVTIERSPDSMVPLEYDAYIMHPGSHPKGYGDKPCPEKRTRLSARYRCKCRQIGQLCVVDDIELIACYPHRSKHRLEDAIPGINEVAKIKHGASVSEIKPLFGKSCSSHTGSLLIPRTRTNQFMRQEGPSEISTVCDSLYNRLMEQDVVISELRLKVTNLTESLKGNRTLIRSTARSLEKALQNYEDSDMDNSL